MTDAVTPETGQPSRQQKAIARLETWLAVMRDKQQSDGDDAEALRTAIDALRAAAPASPPKQERTDA